MNLPHFNLPAPSDLKPFAIVAGIALGVHYLAEKVEHTSVTEYLKETLEPTPDGTQVREIMSPAPAWALGISPIPTAAERHIIDRRNANPAPEDATQSQIREEWRAHKAVGMAIERGDLIRPGTHNRKSAKYMEAHHPDYARPLDIRWETKAEHAGMDHDY